MLRACYYNYYLQKLGYIHQPGIKIKTNNLLQFTNLNSNSVAIMLAISSFYAFEKETSVQSEMHFGQCQGQTTLFRIEIVRMCVKIECDCKIVSKDNIDFYLLFEVFEAFFLISMGFTHPLSYLICYYSRLHISSVKF